ncbi:MAG: sigma 54-interacting transcriptional regulator, partial [Coriobacteriales bacterium]
MIDTELEDGGCAYEENAMAAAWRLFMNTGVVDENVVRPVIARSWRRCRSAGVNPWSLEFPPANEGLLAEKRKLYSHSIEANEPVMQVLMALLKCNVSLMDQENFVFAFETPLPNYPRTKGTYQHECVLGTGNSTVVAYEKRPVRVDGFEQYRSVSHGYSGVSSPYIDVDGEYFGALNLNSPFGPLPPQALDMCAAGVSLCNELFSMGRDMWSCLRSVEFFQPLANMMTDPVAFLDARGNLLLVNDAMRPYVPGFEERAYGTCSLSDYLDRKSPLKSVMSVSLDSADYPLVYFRAPRKKAVKELHFRNRTELRLHNGLHFVVLVFKDPALKTEEAVSRRDEYTRRTLSRRFPDETAVDYIGESPEWKAVDAIVDRISKVNANAFILGETGTGKEMVARAIHRRSGRPGPFIAINCGAIPRDLFAAELFGYEPGAFTGAKEEGAIGKIEAANHGTILLDEIGEMPLDLQVGLLRVIQEQGVVRLGSSEVRPLDVRFLAATNQDVARMIEDKQFRADLYYRLSSIEINLPPLRRRADDVPLLME